MDENDSPVKTLEAANAWPTEAFKKEGNTSAMGKLVLDHEGETVK